MTTLTFTVTQIVRQGSDLTVWANAESPVLTGDGGEGPSEHLRGASLSMVLGNVVDPSPYVVGATFTADFAQPVTAPPADLISTPGGPSTSESPEQPATPGVPPSIDTPSSTPPADPNYPHGGSTPVI